MECSQRKQKSAMDLHNEMNWRMISRNIQWNELKINCISSERQARPIVDSAKTALSESDSRQEKKLYRMHVEKSPLKINEKQTYFNEKHKKQQPWKNSWFDRSTGRTLLWLEQNFYFVQVVISSLQQLWNAGIQNKSVSLTFFTVHPFLQQQQTPAVPEVRSARGLFSYVWVLFIDSIFTMVAAIISAASWIPNLSVLMQWYICASVWPNVPSRENQSYNRYVFSFSRPSISTPHSFKSPRNSSRSAIG